MCHARSHENACKALLKLLLLLSLAPPQFPEPHKGTSGMSTMNSLGNAASWQLSADTG